MDTNIERLEEEIRDLKKKISALEIDSQRHIKRNVAIPSGIATKVSYDSNGLIVKGTKLESSDIPEISLDQVLGLRKLLDDKIGSSEYKKLQIEASNNVLKKGEPVATGTKINYDENGLVISSSDLLTTDIPLLPMSKIEGLAERMALLETYHKSDDESTNPIKVEAGTFCKVTYDTQGRVLSGSNLSINDIPMDLINRVVSLESVVPGLASSNDVNEIRKDVYKKLDANDRIGSGTFTKVTVDSNGLVTKGDRLTIKDLPEINISDIIDLETILRKKADSTDIINLNNTVSSMVNSLSKLGDIQSLKNTIIMKADANEVKSINAQIISMRQLMDTLANKIPNELILDQLSQITSQISELSGRISVLERKFETSP